MQLKTRVLTPQDSWELRKEGSHENGRTGSAFSAPRYSQRLNFAKALATRCTEENVPPARMAGIFRDESEAYPHLVHIESLTKFEDFPNFNPRGLAEHLDQMRSFAKHHFSNPKHLPHLLGLVQVAMEPFDGKSLGITTPKTILSRKHADAIRSVPPPYNAFLADELRHIYNESWHGLAGELAKADINIYEFEKHSRLTPPSAPKTPPGTFKKIAAFFSLSKPGDEEPPYVPFTDLARTESLSKALDSGKRELAGLSFVVDSKHDDKKSPLYGLGARGPITTDEVKGMVEALNQDDSLTPIQRRLTAMGHIYHSFGTEFGGTRSSVPREVAVIHTTLNMALSPYFDPKARAQAYKTGNIPTVEQALAADRKIAAKAKETAQMLKKLAGSPSKPGVRTETHTQDSNHDHVSTDVGHHEDSPSVHAVPHGKVPTETLVLEQKLHDNPTSSSASSQAISSQPSAPRPVSQAEIEGDAFFDQFNNTNPITENTSPSQPGATPNVAIVEKEPDVLPNPNQFASPDSHGHGDDYQL